MYNVTGCLIWSAHRMISLVGGHVTRRSPNSQASTESASIVVQGISNLFRSITAFTSAVVHTCLKLAEEQPQGLSGEYEIQILDSFFKNVVPLEKL